MLLTMSKGWLATGAFAVVAAAVGVVVLVAQRGGGDQKVIQPAALIRAFASRGITIRYDPAVGLAPSAIRIRAPLGRLSTRLNRVAHGNLDIVVLASTEDAALLGTARPQLPNTRDECGQKLSADVFQLRVKNVVVTYDRCDFSRKPYRLAPAVTYTHVIDTLGSLGRVSTP
jgi:hypothetical protein